MSHIGARGRRQPRSYLLALLVLAIGAGAACWALTALFPTELQQAGQWMQAKVGALLT